MCRRIEEVGPTVGLPRHRHFVGFFNVPFQTPTRDSPFYGYSEKPPHFSRLLQHAWGYGGHILDLNPRGRRLLHCRYDTRGPTIKKVLGGQSML